MGKAIGQSLTENDAGFASAIPYRAASFPEELLGDWISRLSALNSHSTIFNFAKYTGISQQLKTHVADPINGPRYLLDFAPHLGYSPDKLLSKFTTLSYWRAFAGEDLSKEPAPKLSTPLLRICPACVRDDARDPGFAYIHRDHQLRSRACAKHGLMLIDRCRDCDTPICPAEGFIVVGPSASAGPIFRKEVEISQ